GSEARADEAVSPIRTEHGHSRTVRHLDSSYFSHPHWVDHRYVVLASDSDPQFPSIRREERLMRRSPHVNGAFTLFVAVSISVTEFEAIDTTASVFESGE